MQLEKGLSDFAQKYHQQKFRKGKFVISSSEDNHESSEQFEENEVQSLMT